jgi:hypothetical protein
MQDDKVQDISHRMKVGRKSNKHRTKVQQMSDEVRLIAIVTMVAYITAHNTVARNAIVMATTLIARNTAGMVL